MQIARNKPIKLIICILMIVVFIIQPPLLFNKIIEVEGEAILLATTLAFIGKLAIAGLAGYLVYNNSDVITHYASSALDNAKYYCAVNQIMLQAIWNGLSSQSRYFYQKLATETTTDDVSQSITDDEITIMDEKLAQMNHLKEVTYENLKAYEIDKIYSMAISNYNYNYHSDGIENSDIAGYAKVGDYYYKVNNDVKVENFYQLGKQLPVKVTTIHETTTYYSSYTIEQEFKVDNTLYQLVWRFKFEAQYQELDNSKIDTLTNISETRWTLYKYTATEKLRIDRDIDYSPTIDPSVLDDLKVQLESLGLEHGFINDIAYGELPNYINLGDIGTHYYNNSICADIDIPGVYDLDIVRDDYAGYLNGLEDSLVTGDVVSIPVSADTSDTQVGSYSTTNTGVVTNVNTNTPNPDNPNGPDWSWMQGLMDAFLIFYWLVLILIKMLLVVFKLLKEMLVIPARPDLVPEHMKAGIDYVKTLQLGEFPLSFMECMNLVVNVSFFTAIARQIQRLYMNIPQAIDGMRLKFEGKEVPNTNANSWRMTKSEINSIKNEGGK